tara:strand:- start:2 stop:295 length:294 start_codon:yes stop_codon:yes gene_type:complete
MLEFQLFNEQNIPEPKFCTKHAIVLKKQRVELIGTIPAHVILQLENSCPFHGFYPWTDKFILSENQTEFDTKYICERCHEKAKNVFGFYMSEDLLMS